MKSHRTLALVSVCGLVLALSGRAHVPRSKDHLAPADASRPAARAFQALTPDGETLLRSTIQSGALQGLRWPDFSDYRNHVAKFYEATGYRLPWLKDMQPTPQARAVVALFEQSASKGLTPEDYDAPRWQERLAKLRPSASTSSQSSSAPNRSASVPNESASTPNESASTPSESASVPNESDIVNFDLALTISLMRYISDLHIGKVNPQYFQFNIDVARKKYDLPEFLSDHVVNAADASSVLAQVEPPYPGYRRTLNALQSYLAMAREDDGESLPATAKAVAPGQPYPGVPRLERLLRRLGDLPSSAPASSGNVYQGALVEGVKSFQKRHGLVADGRIDSRTLEELNVPLSHRVHQMQLSLERWRWMPTEYQQAPIVVNIPEFHLRAYDKDFKIGVNMNVVVGQAYRHDTPVFLGLMRYLIFRPYWQVPPSIAQREILPALQRKPGYLAKENLEFVDRSENPISDASLPSDFSQGLREGRLFLRQKPGPKNSLGLVKFMFPNQYDVYLHDTPATELFEKSRRDFSHGCIRLERPADLAAWVLRENAGWTPERIGQVMHGEKTEQVNLSHPIPVLILYVTVFVSEDGVVHFYDDIYGHDAQLDRVLEKGYPYPG